MLDLHYRVFVSHSSRDEGVARLIKYCVQSLGGIALLSEDDLKVGSSIQTGIKDLIKQSQEVIYLLSPDFLTSEWLRYEYAVADGCDLYHSPLLHGLGQADVSTHPFWQKLMIDRSSAELKGVDKYFKELQKRINDRSIELTDNPEFVESDKLASFLAKKLRDVKGQ
jgi:hypothetical protein